MNNTSSHYRLYAAALALALAPLTSVAEHNRPVIAVNGTQEEIFGEMLSRGASQESVLKALGEPGLRVARNVWVYFNYDAIRPTNTAKTCDALVVAFSGGKVVQMKLVPRSDVEALAARVKTPTPVAVANK